MRNVGMIAAAKMERVLYNRGGLMAIMVFFFFVWFICKGLKALFKRKPRIEYKPPAETQNKVVRNLAALDALQKQREQIETTIDYIKESITTSETPEKTIQYMDRLSSLYGKLASVENKISKLISRE